ncbi:galactokinase [Shewanella decolorationis]|uniref:Galactokinase n=2 Tax=Shewanella decolorationis TaxID=256839 RepID=A0A5B8R176_9GAMM|nr:galactokinase [Shewanella decolorationis]ESE39688.1 galactokinase [Shewanella decolorationis S12]QDZ92415.1 galactokinase [Shewanella decolorationis]GLR32786.1 galactokinase [Shewanella decolorationis]
MSNPAQRATKLFVQTFGTKADDLYQAPGRVNLIGEYTDYNDGFVLPAAINFHTVIAVKRREDNKFRAVADAFPGQIKEWSFGKDTEIHPEDGWVNYLKGLTVAMANTGLIAKGLDLAVVGDVPLAAGLSSSGALVVAFGTAISDSSQLHLSPMAVAQLAQRGEYRYVSSACSIMDHMVCAMGEPDHALLIDCLDLDSEQIAIPENLSLIIIDAHIEKQRLAAINELRREECAQAAEYFGLDALRHLDLRQLESAKDKLDETLYRRAKHVVTENKRTQSAARALEQNNLSKFSQLMAQSHQSLRDDFEVTLPEFDTLVDIVSQVIGERGGIRMTDGCVVALVDHELTDAVVSAVEQAFFEQTGIDATVYLCSASAGAGRIDS